MSFAKSKKYELLGIFGLAVLAFSIIGNAPIFADTSSDRRITFMNILLSGMQDVNVTGITSGQCLQSNGTLWQNTYGCSIAGCSWFVNQVIGATTRTIQGINCNTGKVVYSSTNASAVFNSVLSQINISNGGTVHIVGYNVTHPYNITKAIQLPESGHLNLIGEGPEYTVLKIPSGLDNNMFEYAGNHTKHIAFFNSFSSFQMQGNKGSGGVNNRGFYINTTSGEYIDSVWYNMFLRDFKTDDIYIGSLISGINNCWNNKFDDMTIELGGRSGMYVVGGINCQDLKVTESKFLYNHDYGVFQDGYFNQFQEGFYYNQSFYGFVNNGGVGNVINANRFYDNGAQTNNVYYDLWNLGNDNVISANNFEGSDRSQKPKYAIFEDTFTHRNTIVGNHISTSTRTYATGTVGFGDKQQDNNLVTNNVGFNPAGKISSAFYTGTTGIGTTIIPNGGNSTLPRNATVFTNTNTPIYMSVSGGSGVSIELQDNNGNVIQTGLTTLTEQQFSFGYKGKITWSSAPTVTVYFQ